MPRMIELLLLSCLPPLPGFYDTRPIAGANIPENGKIVLVGETFTTPYVQLTQGATLTVPNIDIENWTPRAEFNAAFPPGEFTLFANSNDPMAQSVTATFIAAAGNDTVPPTFAGIVGITYEWFADDEP